MKGFVHMGASGWNYVRDYAGDPAASLAALHAEEFAVEGSYFRQTLEDWGIPQPSALAELWGEDYGEFMGTNGTHSILDIPSIRYLKPLTAEEAAQVFGVERPTRADWDEAVKQHRDRLWQVVGERWTGRYALLFQDGEASEIAFWGYSGD